MSSATEARTRRVGILLYPDVEVLDAAGPFEVFTCASRMAQRASPEAPPPFSVHTLALAAGPVRARAGLRMLADQALAQAAPPDVWLVPGGVVDAALADAELLAQIARLAAGAEITASVCTGAFLLAAAGLLPPGTPVTTHWEDAADLARAHPRLAVDATRRYLDNGRLVTAAGISAGIDMALHLVARLAGPALAERTARQMDVVWTRDLWQGRPLR
ncbi:DJ-1/PfpI family protein [Aquabacterium sp. OR-4]|uniref:DJ-1/PfpI family protein n=1 Tax=Aquabacterium sp. OR-4 TaxID=2978127 RepID=UPI0021B21297|nr:DJ-1/PfpI family protein [Aquabacterium sp. OR-4]MDT7837528.1 DJ-1/PfpI family protein [Aquabacterium sp. OR-4]